MNAGASMGCPLISLTELTLPLGSMMMSAVTLPPRPAAFASGGTVGSTFFIRLCRATFGSTRRGVSCADECTEATSKRQQASFHMG
jgi:hypothetical protein